MSDKTDGDNDQPAPDHDDLPRSETTNTAVPPVQPIVTIPAVENDEAKDAAVHKSESTSHAEANQRLADRIDRSDRWMIALTAVIAIATIGNVFVYYRESESAGKQTDKLIAAAKIQAGAASDNADAAQQFSDTADYIADEMSDAVSSFQKSADASRMSARLAQRALDPIIELTWSTVDVSDTEMNWSLIVKNQGGSAADVHLRYCLAGRHIREAPTISICDIDKSRVVDTTFTVPPHDQAPFVIKYGDANHIAEIRSGSIWLFVPIVMSYKTSQGKVGGDTCYVYREPFKMFGPCIDLQRPSNQGVTIPKHD